MPLFASHCDLKVSCVSSLTAVSEVTAGFAGFPLGHPVFGVGVSSFVVPPLGLEELQPADATHNRPLSAANSSAWPVPGFSSMEDTLWPG